MLVIRFDFERFPSVLESLDLIAEAVAVHLVNYSRHGDPLAVVKILDVKPCVW